MKSSLLVIVPCGKSKIWKKHPLSKNVKAAKVYRGSPFKVNNAFAQKFADKWVILSAKYGFIEPDFIIPEDYNVSFNDSNTNPIKITELKKQVQRMGLDRYELVIALGGKNYAKRVVEVIPKTSKVSMPAAGRVLGNGMKFVKELTELDREQMLEKVFEVKKGV